MDDNQHNTDYTEYEAMSQTNQEGHSASANVSGNPDDTPAEPQAESISAPATPLQNAEQDTLSLPPHNLDIEASLLGAILRNDTILSQKLDKLVPEHFFAPEHQTIFTWIKQTVEAGQKSTPATLAHLADTTPNIKALGGKQYLNKLASDVISLINASEYQDTLMDLFARRQLITLGEDVITSAHDLDFDNTASHQIEVAEQTLYNLAEKGDMDKGTLKFSDAIGSALNRAEKAFISDGSVVGVSTGLLDLDKELGGLHPSDLLILAGRPSMGKTALVTNIAFHVGQSYKVGIDGNGKQHQQGGVVMFFSLEMSAEQLAGRILSEQSKISSDKIRRGNINEDQFSKLTETVHNINQAQLYIDDTPGLSVTAMRQKARRQQRKHGLDVIIVDYLQLLQGPAGKKFDNRVNEVSEITRHLKLIAKDLNVPVIALSQLSRAVEQREDKRPQLSDLRESGSIEQDADVVMFIYRQEYYIQKEGTPERRDSETEEKYMDRVERFNQKVSESRNKAEVIIAKQRHGPIGIVELSFNSEFTKFGNFDAHH